MSYHMEGNQFINAADSDTVILLGQESTVVGLLQAMIRVQEAGAPAWMVAQGLRALADDLDPPKPVKKRWRR